jgi:uncharacterized protein
MSTTSKMDLKISGTHCASCEIMIEQTFTKIPGISKVKVNHVNGKTQVWYTQKPSLKRLDKAIAKNGYSVSLWNDAKAKTEQNQPSEVHQNTKKDYIEIGLIFFVVMAAFLVLSRFDLIPAGLQVSNQMSYGFIFMIGLVAAVSTCIAVVGGLLLALASTYNTNHPERTGMARMRPHLFFNVGRVASYSVLGAGTGALGSVFALSSWSLGFVTIVAGAVMLHLGLRLLKLFPSLGRFQPRMPKWIGSRVHDMSTSDKWYAPFLVGAGTFFLPCGFTQALQLYVLSQGDALTGGLTMFFFSLGTLPALVSLGVVSSFAKGAFQKYFLRFAGVMVVLVGLYSMNNGFELTGFKGALASAFRADDNGGRVTDLATPNTRIENGKQIAEMRIVGYTYEPNQFIVQAGVPVEWRIDASKAAGCGQILSVPSLDYMEYLDTTTTNILSFTPENDGYIEFNCAMGMMTRNSFFKISS